MLYFLLKAVISGLMVAAASEVARRTPAWGALIVSLPVVSILAMLWLWRDTGDAERVAQLAFSNFWLVLPTLPLFLIFPALIRHGAGLWPALAFSCLVTVALYALTLWLLSKFGVNL